MSDVREYRALLAERDRIEAFQRAIHEVVQDGDTVLEIGAGLGTFSFFAADAGAAKVWAVDSDPIVHVAKVIGSVNGYDDRVEFIRGRIPEVSLPEKCDVVLFEDFPSRLMSASTFRILRAALRKYASPDVRSVPRRARMMVAPLRSARARRQVFSFDEVGGEDAYGIDWGPSRAYVANSPTFAPVEDGSVLADPVTLGEVWFDRVPEVGPLGGDATWQFDEPAAVDGLAYWFDLELAADQWISNAPTGQPRSWGYLILPADPPILVEAGGELRAEVHPELMPDGAPGWLSWTLKAGGHSARGHEFASMPASAGDLVAQSPDAIPVLADDGRLEANVFRLTDGSRSIRDIAGEIRSGRDSLTQAEAEQTVARVLSGKARPRESAVQKHQGAEK